MLYRSLEPIETCDSVKAEFEHGMAHAINPARTCGLRPDTLWNEPHLRNELRIANENFNFLRNLDFPFYRIRQRRRLGTAGAEGLRGNEA
jgi:hypothetical protein